jgi:hypothetical protein
MSIVRHTIDVKKENAAVWHVGDLLKTLVDVTAGAKQRWNDCGCGQLEL